MKELEAFCTGCEKVTKQFDSTCYLVCHTCGTYNNLSNVYGKAHPCHVKKPELIEGNKYIIDANYNNSSEVVLLHKYGELFCKVKSVDSDYQWETMQNRLFIKTNTPPSETV